MAQVELNKRTIARPWLAAGGGGGAAGALDLPRARKGPDPPGALPGFERLAQRAARLTAAAEELAGVEAAALAWGAVQDAAGRRYQCLSIVICSSPRRGGIENNDSNEKTNFPSVRVNAHTDAPAVRATALIKAFSKSSPILDRVWALHVRDSTPPNLWRDRLSINP